MPSRQIRFNDAERAGERASDGQTMIWDRMDGEEAFVLRLFQRQKESRSFARRRGVAPSLPQQTQRGTQSLHPKPVSISFDSPSMYPSIDQSRA